MNKICGIYKITNLINGKVYIGSSNNIYKRWNNEHKYLLNINKHFNDHLQSSWNKYGKKNFKFEIEEPCLEELLIVREDYNINKYDSMNPDKGYNKISATRQIMSEEIKSILIHYIIDKYPYFQYTKTKYDNFSPGVDDKCDSIILALSEINY